MTNQAHSPLIWVWVHPWEMLAFFLEFSSDVYRNGLSYFKIITFIENSNKYDNNDEKWISDGIFFLPVSNIFTVCGLFKDQDII